IMATALNQSEDVVEALRRGANDYVTKPIDFPVLLARIQTQLSLRRAVEQVQRLERRLTRQNVALKAANRNLRTANARMHQDLQAATRIQEAFLPSPAPAVLGARFAWL